MQERKVGIYCIKNMVNNRCYIGQSDDIYTRWEQHKSALKNGNGTYKLQKDWNKYGEDFFEFFILEETSYSQYELDKKESYYVYKYDSWEKGYNVAKLLDYSCITVEEIESLKPKLLNFLSKQNPGRYTFSSLSKILNISNTQLAIIFKNVMQEEMIAHDLYFNINVNYSYDNQHTIIELMTWSKHVAEINEMNNSILNIDYDSQ